MIFLLLFINLFAPCSSDITYSKLLNVYENNETTSYLGYVKGHMNIDDVIYKELYITKFIWFNKDEITLKITTLDDVEYDCEAWTLMLTVENLNKEVRNCMCKYTSAHYILEYIFGEYIQYNSQMYENGHIMRGR